ncbi:MAG: AtpZ/AtpI family protein [Candidatus Omnitrophica bacterium]|nr:AtpZ/AtpI family protein [Candidatus Omnitrophota bacterium]
MPDPSPKDRSDYSTLSRLWSIGGGLIVLPLLGWWLDKKFHTFPVLTIVGAALGVSYCFYEAWRAFREK